MKEIAFGQIVSEIRCFAGREEPGENILHPRPLVFESAIEPDRQQPNTPN
jgi:hypothetical protein